MDGSPARSQPAPGEPVRSPCIDVCEVDHARRLCTGCLRTLDEIAAWPSASDEQRRRILARLAERAGRARG